MLNLTPQETVTVHDSPPSESGAAKGSSRHLVKKMALALGATLLLFGVGYLTTYSADNPSHSTISTSPKNLDITISEDFGIIAYVNSQPVFEEEISELYPQTPKAVALDNYITKVIAAQANSDTSPENLRKTKKKIIQVVREVQASAYLSELAKTTQAAITESDIADYYARNISDAMFTKYEVSYSLYADLNSALQASSILADKLNPKYAEVFKLLKRFQSDGKKDELFTSSQFPYDLGKVVDQLKPSDFSQPLPTRSGYFILYLHGKVAGTKPEVKDVKAQIVKTMVQQRLTEKLISLRGSARIELK